MRPKLLRKLATTLIAGVLSLSAQQAAALGGAFLDAPGTSPIGLTCNFHPYNDAGIQEAQVNMTLSGFTSASTGSNYWFGGNVTSWPLDVLATDIATQCGVTNVDNFVSDGADNGSYAADDFMGVKFRATASDGNTYDYVLGIQGVSSSVLVNTRTLVVPPANTVPTADAGADQPSVASAASVSLDGSGSAANDAGQTLTYAWTQTSGTGVTLTGNTTATPSFTAPTIAIGGAAQTLVFSLVVNDGFDNSAADTVSVTVTPPANTAPTVTISGVPSTYVPGVPFDVTVTFSETVTGFNASGLTVTGGTVASVSGSGSTYVVSIVAGHGASDLSVLVASNSATDAFGAGNLASNTVSLVADNAEETKEEVFGFLQTRSQALIGSQPVLSQVRTKSQVRAFASNGVANLNFALGDQSQFWVTGAGQWSKDDGVEQDYFNLVLGGVVWKNQTTTLGLLAQFDSANSSNPQSEFSGKGWLVGPYAVYSPVEQNLTFSASLLAGKTSNSLTQGGQAPVDFSSERVLGTARIEGEYAVNAGTLIIPSLDLVHFSETQAAFVNVVNVNVPSQKLSQTEASFGLGFKTPIQTNHGSMTLTGGVNGIASRSKSDTGSTSSHRMKLSLGTEYTGQRGGVLSVNTYYDGIGISGYSAYGISLGYGLKF